MPSDSFNLLREWAKETADDGCAHSGEQKLAQQALCALKRLDELEIGSAILMARPVGSQFIVVERNRDKIEKHFYGVNDGEIVLLYTTYERFVPAKVSEAPEVKL